VAENPYPNMGRVFLKVICDFLGPVVPINHKRNDFVWKWAKGLLITRTHDASLNLRSARKAGSYELLQSTRLWVMRRESVGLVSPQSPKRFDGVMFDRTRKRDEVNRLKDGCGTSG